MPDFTQQKTCIKLLLDTPRGVAYAADLLVDSAKKAGKERTQTTARRNQNNASERRFGGGTANSLLDSRHLLAKFGTPLTSMKSAIKR